MLQRAHQRWDEILGSDEVRLVVSLQPGDTVIVANQVSWGCEAFRSICRRRAIPMFSFSLYVAKLRQ